MSGCTTVFSISDGTLQVDIPLAALHDDYAIERRLIEDGVDIFRAADGGAKHSVRFEAKAYEIRGAGVSDPGLWALDLDVDFWTVTIPGFSNGSPPEIWNVLPARPRQTRRRRGQQWTLSLEDA